jgi:hypothetical protein
LTINGGSRARFAQKSCARFFIANQFGSQRFDGDRAVQLGILRLIDDAHSAFADLLENLVVKYGSPDH